MDNHAKLEGLMKERQEDSKFACMIYSDTFERLSKAFNDESLGRVLRAALNFGFAGELPELSSPVEDYACGELIDAFRRNRESYDRKVMEGKINAHIKWAKSQEDLRERLSGIEGCTVRDIDEATRKFNRQNKRKVDIELTINE